MARLPHGYVGLRLHALILGLLLISTAHAAPAGPVAELAQYDNYHEAFNLDPHRKPTCRITLIQQNAPANIFHPGEQPQLTFQFENLSNEKLRTTGHLELIAYRQRSTDNMWAPRLEKTATIARVKFELDLPPRGWVNQTFSPSLPQTHGGYAMVFDLESLGRIYGTSLVRTFKASCDKIQYGKQALDALPASVMRRMGFNAVGRMGANFVPVDHPAYAEKMRELETRLADYQAHNVTVMIETAVGSLTGFHQPLGQPRPHLDENGVTRPGKTDIVWLPEFDQAYEDWLFNILKKHGYPHGPITAVDLWNEPWEGSSISGWQADMTRYREIYKRTGDAVFRARREAGADVLIGGCDSSANTWDKLFGEGLENSPFWPEYLDFCGIHYQGMNAPSLHPEWINRKHYKGRVLIWDTESWVANADDVYAGVVASKRAAGYDRCIGTRWDYAIGYSERNRVTIQTATGAVTQIALPESRPLAASYAAVQHFIGERDFHQVLFHQSRPWVFTFDGLQGNKDDGTVVVLGDMAKLFNTPSALLARVKPLSPDRTPALIIPITNNPPITLHDFFGNPIPSDGDRIVIPLDHRGFFLRADPAVKGSFDALVQAIRTARVDGYEPVEIAAQDMTRPIEQRPSVKLRLTNQLERPISAALSVHLGQLSIAHPPRVALQPRERLWIEVPVTGGSSDASNRYPMTVRVDAGADGVVEHREEMRVNWISRRTITVDGDLSDWQGTIPQVIDRRGGEGGASFEEKMWLPFQKFPEGTSAEGLATGYVAHDDAGFYFAARIADATPHEGAPRCAARDDDEYFYPAVATFRDAKTGKSVELRWPEGVRRFSYRQAPAIPSSFSARPYDNVLLAFNAIPSGQDGWIEALPGRPAKLVVYKSTDYQFALNSVAARYGGGVEVWRLDWPGMPRKHFFPRQPRHPLEGPAPSARLAVKHEGATRVCEAFLPWDEIPHVQQLLRKNQPVKFSFRINHDSKAPAMELGIDRSLCEGASRTFSPDWSRSWPNEIEFGWDTAAP